MFFILAYASSFIPVKIDEQLLLRNVPHVAASGGEESDFSQIKELGIESKKVDLAIQNEKNAGGEWGTATQIGEHTWTIKVGEDKTTGTAQELLAALNAYRQRHGKGILIWDNKLGEFAQLRAAYFASKGDLDSHAGFTDYINNQDGFKKLGFMSVGENSSYGYTLEAVHVIEWVYAGDKPHDDNQLNGEWTHVGIGVDGTATDFVFGGKKF